MSDQRVLRCRGHIALTVLLALGFIWPPPAATQESASTERTLDDALAFTVPAQIDVARDDSSNGPSVYRFTRHDELLLIVRMGDLTRKTRAPRGASAETIRLPGLLAQSLTWSNAAGMRLGEVRVRWDVPRPAGFAQLSYGPLSAADATLVQRIIRSMRRHVP